MLTPIARLRDVRAGNPRAAVVAVLAGDVQDVAVQLDPKDPAVSACMKLALPAERPGVSVRVPGEALDKLIDLASRPVE